MPRQQRNPLPEPFAPMSVGEIVSLGSTIWQKRLGRFMLISLVTYVPIALLVLMVVREAVPLGAFLDQGQIFAPEGSSGRLNILLNLGMLASLLGTMVATASLHVAMADAYANDEAPWTESVRAALRRAPAILGLSVLSIMIMLAPVFGAVLSSGSAGLSGLEWAGALISIVLGGSWASVAMAALMREGIGPFAAARRAWDLTRHRIGPFLLVSSTAALAVGVVALLLGFIMGAATAGVGPATTPVGAITRTTLIEIASALIIAPLWIAMMTVTYLDLRVRAEGYDRADFNAEGGGTGTYAPAPSVIDPSTIQLPMAAPTGTLDMQLTPPAFAQIPSHPDAAPPHQGTESQSTDTQPAFPDREPPARGPRWSEPLGPA